MHFAIADLVAKEIETKDYNRFIFGALAPDMSSHDDGSYSIAHFGEINEQKGIKGINWIRFYNKYQDKIFMDDFLLGYFVHLIVDAYWLKHIQNRFIRKYPVEVKSILRAKGYRDMYNYNRLLIDKYRLVNTVQVVQNINVNEINEINIEPFLRELEKDFICEKKLDTKFEVYPSDDIMIFIQKAYETCICKVNAIRANLTIGSSEEFYVEI